MKNISIITDSCSDLPINLLKEMDIKIVPQHYRFDDQTEYGGEKEISRSEFYSRIRNGEIAQTSACSPSSAVSILKQELDKGNDLICIPISSALSCTYNVIRMAALELADDYPEQKIAVIDSLTASVAQGMMIYTACRMRNEGQAFEEIIDHIESHKLSYHIEFFVDDLGCLARGGRLNPALAKIGGVLGIKPILYVTDQGTIEVGAKGRRVSGAKKIMKERFLASHAEQSSIVGIVHADNLESALALKKELELEDEFEHVFISELCPAIGSHTGADCLGLAYIKKHDNQ